MKVLFLAAAALAAPALTEAELSVLRNIPHLGWKAGIPKRLAGLSRNDLRAMLLNPVFLRGERAGPMATATAEALPEAYSVYEQYPNCMPEVYDQGNCGSCWSFAATAAFADRRCVAGLDAQHVHYSEQDLVSCSKRNMGCNGGWLQNVWKDLKTQGVTTTSCLSYKSGETGVTGKCPSSCDDGSSIARTMAPGEPVNYATSVQSIQSALVEGGSMEVAFTVYADFYYYEGGVYKHRYGGQEGGHAVTLVGYGAEEDGTPYWLVRNSWGAEWGEEGYFRILRGNNECGIEEQAFATEF